MTNIRTRTLVLIPAGFTVFYIAGKIQFALEGRLGIHGGPAVTEAERAQYVNEAQISLAQGANAAVGMLILVAVVLPVAPVSRRWHPLTLSIPLALLAAALTAIGVFTLVGSVTDERGGHLFGTFCTLWGLSILLLATLRTDQRDRAHRAHTTGNGDWTKR